MAVDPARFRALFGSVPACVSIVTTLDRHGEPRGLTCSAVSAVSLDPPLLLVCVDRRSRTLGPLLAHGAFVVNVLAERGRAAGEVFAGRSEDKFGGLVWRPSRPARGAPVLGEIVAAHAECVTVRTLPAGDHVIVIGRVDGAVVHPRRPLLYHDRSYAVCAPIPAIAESVPDAPVRREPARAAGLEPD